MAVSICSSRSCRWTSIYLSLSLIFRLLPSVLSEEAAAHRVNSKEEPEEPEVATLMTGCFSSSYKYEYLPRTRSILSGSGFRMGCTRSRLLSLKD